MNLHLFLMLLKMPFKFFSFLKTKKTLFILLFLVFSLLASTTKAACWGGIMPWAGCDAQNTGEALRNNMGSMITGGDKAAENIKDAIKKDIKEAGSDFFKSIVFAVAWIGVMIFGTLANFAGWLLLGVLDVTNSVSFTQITGDRVNLAVATGWPLVRDLANMMVVLGFVVVAIAFALRMESYGSKKILVNLIISALLINFSLVVCGVFIDASNIAMNSFKSGGYLQQTWTKNVADQIGTLTIEGSKVADFTGKAVGMVLEDIIMFIVFMLFFFLLFARYYALWILVILSPLAFVCYVFPSTKNIWSMWWKNFTQWCIIGIPAMFFLWLANATSSGMKNLSTNSTTTSTIGADFSKIMEFLIPAGFLLIGFMFSLQIAPMGSSAAKKAFNWTKGKSFAGLKVAGTSTARMLGTNLNRAGNWASNKGDAMGGKLGWTVKKIGQGAQFMGGSGGIIQKTRSAVGRGLEKAGFKETGGQAIANTKAIDEHAQKYGAALKSGNEQDTNMTVEKAMSGSSPEAIGAGKALARDGKLKLIKDKKKRQEVIANMLQAGVKFEDIASGMESDDLADVLNNPATNSLMKAKGIDKNELRSDAFKALMKRGDLNLISAAGTTRKDAVENSIAHGLRIEDAEKVDFHYGRQNSARLEAISGARFGRSFNDPTITDVQRDTMRDDAEEQTLDKNFPSMTHEQLRNVDDAYLTSKRLDKLTPDKIGAFKLSSLATRRRIKAEIRSLIPDARTALNNYVAARAAGDQAVAASEYNEYKRLRGLLKAARDLPRTP